MSRRDLQSAVEEGSDVIDSRDVIARIEELECEREYIENTDAQDEDHEGETAERLKEWDEGDNGEELAKLRKLAEQADGAPDWQYGETLISDNHFEDYARELAEDIGALENCDKWPATCIDWKQAAEELQQDYTSVEYGGTTYWLRS